MQRSMGGGGWRGVGVRKRARKRFRSIRCGCEKGRIYHRTFPSKAVAGVFAVFATGRYYRMYSNWAQEADLAQGGLDEGGLDEGGLDENFPIYSIPFKFLM